MRHCLVVLLLACTTPEDPPSDQPPEACPLESTPLSPAESWTPLAPAPGGEVRYIVPTADPDVVYAGAVSGGFFTSDDGGWSWDRQLVDAPPHAYGQIAVDPDDPHRALFSAGILHRWENGTATPLPLGDVANGRVRGVLWTSETILAIDASGEVYASDDDGDTFTHLSTLYDTPPPHATAEEVDASYYTLAYDGHTLYAAHEGGSLFRSGDGGTWEAILGGEVATHSLVAAPGDLLVATGTSLWRSTDGGDSFAELAAVDEIIRGIARRDDGTVAIVGDTRVWRFDGALTELTVPADRLYGAGWLTDGSLLVGPHDGLLRSDGDTFVPSDAGLTDANLSVVFVHPDCPGLVLVGSECNRGLYRSTDGGGSFVHDANYMHYVMEIVVNPSRPEELWVSADDHLLRSRDYGETWEEVHPAVAHVHGVAVDPADADVILAGTVGSGELGDERARIFRTEDDGETWEESTGLPAFDGSIHAIAFSTEGIVVASTWKGGIFHDEGAGIGLWRSGDGGRTWEEALADPPSFHALAACDAAFFAAGEHALYRSVDGARRWEPVADGHFPAVTCDEGRVWLHAHEVVAWSDDLGDTWTTIDEAIPWSHEEGPANDLAVVGSVVYATANGTGVFARTLGPP